MKGKDFMNHVIELTTETFDAALQKGNTAIIVDFWAEWCAPCKLMKPTFEKAAAARSTEIGGTAFATVDIEKNEALADRFELRSIPTFIAFYEGKEVNRITGFQSPAAFEAFVNSL